MINCNNCIHQGICKLEERYKELSEKSFKSSDDGDFEIEVKCKKFKETDRPTKEILDKLKDDTSIQFTTNQNPCYSCSHYWTPYHSVINPCDGCPFKNNRPDSFTVTATSGTCTGIDPLQNQVTGASDDASPFGNGVSTADDYKEMK